VGAYRLVEELGRGGMGEVWLAEDPTGAAGGAPRRVALKLLSADLAGDPQFQARFGREVAAARRVHGSSVATLLDADLEADPPWLAAEYVAGPTLAEHVAQHGALGESPLRALGAALADALVSIHAGGVVHRDLTPRNVVLGPEGPRVVDFGIAWYPEASTITQAGSVMGTPAWMAPEQLTDDVATAASDVWSWGAVMAYAARGRPAVSASRPEVALHRLAQGQLDLDGLPDWLDPWVRSTMAADPTARPTPEQIRAWITGRAAPSAETVPELLEQTWLVPTVAGPVPDEATRVLQHAEDVALERRSSLAAARWGSALVLVAAALAVGLMAELLVVALVTVVLIVVGVFVMLVRDRNPEKGVGIPPTWSFALAAPVALGAGLSTVIGIFGALIAIVVLLVAFIAFGGDFG
jgi:serine/threonine protein kinase